MDLDTPSEATAAANQSLRARRRTSLPLSVTADRPAKRSSNSAHLRNQPASPEVISSLIDQLSAISVPANDHFENLLVGYHNGTATPAGISRASSARNSISTHDGASGDASSFYNSLRQHNDAYSDDACEPPVIRTAKPPSGLSLLTAPKKKDKAHSLGSYIGRNSASSVSIHSTHSNYSGTSFGAISIEAAAPSKQPVASERSSAESKRSAKGHRGLMYMSSRERLRLKETDRKRQGSSEDSTAADQSRKPPAPSFSYEDTIKEEPTERDENRSFAADPSRLAQRFADRSCSPRRLRLNLVDEPTRESPTDKGIIPERGSSLKHTGSPTRKSKNTANSKADVKEQNETLAVPKQVQKMESKEKILQELEQEENEVAQRIRELREQKLRREQSAGKQPVHQDAGGAPLASIPRVSVIPSPESSPTSMVSSASGTRAQHPSKAHKVLGISRQSSASAIQGEPLARESMNGGADLESAALLHKRLLRHSRHQSSTFDDGEDVTPLPINYTLALQKAEEESPPTPELKPSIEKYHVPPPVSVSSSREARSCTASQRSISVGVGGRSALGRRAASSTSVQPVKGHKSSSSVTSDSALSGMASTLRTASLNSASEENAYRHKSMIVSSQASNSFQLQRRKTLTKKRWSHPDLPAKAEKAHNDQVEKAEAKKTAAAAGAVQKLSHPMVEERPTSADSIDYEVNNYLNSPRLSQKIRHPQTGRIISFSEVGDRNGFAVFVCVGMGLTRYVMSFYDQLAATLRLRLITPDRPGIGGSQVDPNGTPLSWPDDVLVICQALKITKFSLLAHSAGAVYALATSLRMPQHIRGRVHLLAPWIPPSQMAPIGISQDSPPTQQLPRSQRFLRALPPSLLKVANSTFLGATSASLQRTGPKSTTKTRRKSIHPQPTDSPTPRPSLKDNRRESMMLMDQVAPEASTLNLPLAYPSNSSHESEQRIREALSIAERERQQDFDERLTFAIWDRATTNANPATDLVVCLETKRAIGFRYEDINRPVVIHHGSKDSRVPADNVRWLGKLMRKCEVRILEGEQHGLMASAQVMGNVLTEMASDWEDWTAVVQGKGDHRSLSRKRTAERLRTTMSKDNLR